MLKVDGPFSLCDPVEVEDRSSGVFASDLGLPPGAWPEQIAVVELDAGGVVFSGIVTKDAPIYDPRGGFWGYMYTLPQQAVLRVFND